jgi:predicted neutral ceramidase superfamily lipid hydrolase
VASLLATTVFSNKISIKKYQGIFPKCKTIFFLHLKQLHKITTYFAICVYFLVDIHLKNARRSHMLLNFLCIIVLHSFLLCVLEVIFALVDFLTV